MIVAALALLAAGPVIATDDGPVRGEVAAPGGAVFRGIPYAKPPVGPLRWRAPERPAPWRTPIDTIAEHKACPQPVYGEWNRKAAENSAEDCLFLDIRTPSLAQGAKLPVLVWIHGGGNRGGAAGGTVESRITDGGIVLVSLQYRLGALGFMSHAALSAENKGSLGNYALLDQQFALAWIRRNIARFGGDPARVTIAGQSAGAQDVALQQLLPGSRGLFAQAIQESGTAGFGVAPRTLAQNERLGDLIARSAGAPAGATAAQLRALPAAALVAAQEVVDVPDLDDDSFIWLQAVVDGTILPDDPARLLASGRRAPVPLIAGVNARELTLHGGRAAAVATVRREFPRAPDRALSFYGLGAGRTPAADPRLGDVTVQLADDLTFRCPTVALSRLVATQGGRMWQYQFDYGGPTGAIVAHSSELRYVFDAPAPGSPPLQTYWLNFVRTGDPNGAQLASWPRYDARTRGYLSFTDAGAVAGRDLRGAICGLRDTP